MESYLACLYRNLDKAESSCVPIKKVKNSDLRYPWFIRDHSSEPGDLPNEETARRYRRFKKTRLRCDLLWFRAGREQALGICSNLEC